MNKKINFSKPEIFLIGILLGYENPKKTKLLSELKSILPGGRGKKRAIGNCSDHFLNSVYKGLLKNGIIEEFNNVDIKLTKNASLIEGDYGPSNFPEDIWKLIRE